LIHPWMTSLRTAAWCGCSVPKPLERKEVYTTNVSGEPFAIDGTNSPKVESDNKLSRCLEPLL
jgi:hypothetical protein